MDFYSMLQSLIIYKPYTKKPKLFRFVEIRSVQGEQFPSREALTRGIILNSSVDRDDLVTSHDAVVDRAGDLVNVGDYLAYQSSDKDEVHVLLKLCFFTRYKEYLHVAYLIFNPD